MKPYAYAVIRGEDGRENVSLQFDHPEMCGQQYKQAIPLFTASQTKPLSDEEIYSLLDKCIEYTDDHDHAEFMYKKFARVIEAKVRG